jgi:glutaredoxin/glutathione-dependent peroxiredoxin
MTIAVGERIPDVELRMITDHGPEVVSSADVLGKGRVVLFGMPAAFSGTCSDTHLPGYLVRADELSARGVDRIFGVAVNDHHAMGAWARSQGLGDKVTLLADGNGELARAMGVEHDFSKAGMGVRNRRYAAVIEDGVVTHLALEDGGALDVSTADATLSALS